MEKRYTRDGVTVIWKPARCWHSGICARGLPSVFDPGRRPWVDMTQAEVDAITAVVDKCPSRALSWEREEPQAER